MFYGPNIQPRDFLMTLADVTKKEGLLSRLLSQIKVNIALKLRVEKGSTVIRYCALYTVKGLVFRKQIVYVRAD